MRPTRIGEPERVHSALAARRPPHAATAKTTTRTVNMGAYLERRDRSARRERNSLSADSANSAFKNASASAALTDATSIDTPYTPNRLANCAIGSTLVWL